ncbi:hypothetical protein QC764_0097930 [Podospora pseudoanserina]|uniref:CorA-like transporter domain-containing protein n=1 Tax=Podospora pseudoanserina TaxID=2609844 RepID=A0ABR0HUQ6_9PEZI|nr:hypothetical protein QC764_0097930 [Podospora pseudoanserina]
MSTRPWLAAGRRCTHASRIGYVRRTLEPHCNETFSRDLPGEVEVQFISVNQTGPQATPMLESGEDVTAYLDKQQNCEQGEDDAKVHCQYVLLHPLIGRSPLLIPHRQMLHLLESWNVFPEICRYLNAFGKKYFNKDEAFAGFDCVEYEDSNNSSVNKLEMCYLLKYAASKRNEDTKVDAWAIRHALIYQQTCLNTRESSHILVRLSDNMKLALKEALSAPREEVQNFSRDWTRLHSLVLGEVDDGWRQMTNSLDSEVSEIFHRLIASGVIPQDFNMFDSPATVAQDMKHLQRLTDSLRRVSTMISLNIDTVDCLINRVEMFNKGSYIYPDDLLPFLRSLHQFKQEHKFALKNSSAVLERATSLANQLRDTVALRNSEINKNHTEQLGGNTAALANLSEQAGRETSVVKTLTVLALVFVPASFVADFLQMGYVTTDPDNARIWRAAQDLQLYAALAIPLVALTMGFYIVIELRKASHHGQKGPVGAP